MEANVYAARHHSFMSTTTTYTDRTLAPAGDKEMPAGSLQQATRRCQQAHTSRQVRLPAGELEPHRHSIDRILSRRQGDASRITPAGSHQQATIPSDPSPGSCQPDGVVHKKNVCVRLMVPQGDTHTSTLPCHRQHTSRHEFRVSASRANLTGL